MRGARSRVPTVLAAVLAGLGATTPAAAISDCSDAGRYLEMSGNQDREAVLRRIVALCPRHAEALNNLAVLLEQRGELDEAEELYRRAIVVDPDLAAPYAGLGDVMTARERFAEAAKAYEGFLSRVEAGDATGANRELARHAPLYRERLARAQRDAAAGGPAVVPAGQITRSLTTAPPPRMRGLNLHQRTEPHIDLHIRFDFDSDRLRPEADRQIDEIARALAEDVLKERRILIEGHTDSTGTAGYNQSLSERRAAAVRAALVARGIDPALLETAGHGETRPLAGNETDRGQALNRRVTFVNIGAR